MKTEEKLVTLTEDQLERIIRKAVTEALCDVKEMDKLPGNEVDERDEAPASFALIEMITTFALYAVIVFCFLFVIGCIMMFINTSFSWIGLLIMLFFIMIGIMSVLAVREVHNTKKIEVLSTIFSAIMALSTLLVAIFSAYFAYKSIGGGMA